MLRASFTALLLLLSAASAADAGSRHLHLSIGDPERRDREVEIAVDRIVATASGGTLSPAELASELAATDILLVGESHTDIEFHRVQLAVIEELVRAGRQVMIGLEMYPYTEQSFLDGWVAGLYTEEGFLELSDWYRNWGYNWNYYRDIFGFARRHGLPMFAINAPRDVVTAVRKKGFDSLSEEEARHIPRDIDTDSEEQRLMFRAMFDEDDPIHASLTEEQWEGTFQAQCTWDATMGYNAVRAFEEHGGDEAILVVLVGSGHVAYGLGIERQAKRWLDGTITSLIPISDEDDDGEPVERVQASYTDYLWGLPAQDDPFYPSLGLSAIAIGDETYRQVIHVSEDSVAERAGFAVGDVLLEMDGVDLEEKAALNRTVAARRWGDVATFTIRRDGETVELPVAFTRTPADDRDDADADQDDHDED